MYEVVLTPEALKTYRRAEVPLARKLNRCFENLSSDPRSHPNIKPLTGALRGRWRYRLGNWRVVCCISKERREVVVLVIAHRKAAYE